MDGQQPPRIWLHLLMTLISVAGAAAILWMELPPDQRSMMVLEARVAVQRRAHRLAVRAGHLGMGSELRSHLPAAAAGYGIAYRLARLRDRL